MISKIVCICIFLILIYIIYSIIIRRYFRKKNYDCISYNFLKGMINEVSEGNSFMNYGLWIMYNLFICLIIIFEKDIITNQQFII